MSDFNYGVSLLSSFFYFNFLIFLSKLKFVKNKINFVKNWVIYEYRFEQYIILRVHIANFCSDKNFFNNVMLFYFLNDCVYTTLILNSYCQSFIIRYWSKYLHKGDRWWHHVYWLIVS